MIEELVIAAAVRARFGVELPDADEAQIAMAVEHALECYAGGASVSEACRAGWLWAFVRADEKTLQGAA